MSDDKDKAAERRYPGLHSLRRALEGAPDDLPGTPVSQPTTPEPHSEFPLPTTWGDAWPIILWGMLAFSFVLVFAESLLAIIENPMLRAGVAGVSLIGVTAMLIYRQALLAKFRNPTAAQIILIITTVLLVIALSPFVEEKRWPFATWFATQNQDAEIQKTTLTEWLRQAQQERDQAVVERKSAQASWAADLKKMRVIQSQLTDAQRESDQAQQQLAALTSSGDGAHIKTLREQLEAATNKLKAANTEIVQLKADLDAANRRSGNTPDPHSLLAIAILRHDYNSLSVQEKDNDVIK
jgi:hypothetical protein